MRSVNSNPPAGRWLPTTADEIRARGWDAPDVVFVTGDAYVDHPSFAMAVLSRVLESQGFRVAILPQPDWRSAAAWRALGRPRLFYAVSAGNMDSMINHYTANKKRRNDDAYSPGGKIGLRPDRPTPAYAQRCREARERPGGPPALPQPAVSADRRGGDGRDLRPAVHAAAAPALRGAHSRPHDDQGLRTDHAGLLRRLHLLLHHDA